MRPGWDPTRRNRNIGTAKQGHGLDNQLVIPDRWHHDFKEHYERLGRYKKVYRRIHGKEFAFIVEETRRGCIHACTIEDLHNVLWAIPGQDLEGMARVILRQPTRKERILKSCWGRLVYMADIDGDLAPAIMLDAGPPGGQWRCKRSMSLDEKKEFERLRSDGHKTTPDKRHFIIDSDLESIRSTQLYRTLPHEIGHWVDYLESVKRPRLRSRYSTDTDRLSELYHTKPTAEKEVFAHRYADEFRAETERHGRFPFSRELDVKRLKQEGLRIEDFVPDVGEKGNSE